MFLFPGLIVNRQRVRLPPPRHQEFFDLLDFNVGREIELYGRMYKVVDCDNFTRVFLNRIGIAVPDSLKIPEDPYVKTRIKVAFLNSFEEIGNMMSH